ncbi:response regulator [Oculatella sp. LEGE 06141]|uniref:response regulator n=1 Tax=Oculatella sp. LEGE 06141 TaxID=1828648 RepID=UPI00187EE90C|nr:response regulator [Oculatella sp. LEGE 06141]MBE9178121.1 response regulator [Oculatella sp. LEGE 06141]
MGVSNKAILCVDDERTVLLGLRDQIAKHFGDRYRYEIAESVNEAWEVIDELDQDGVRILIIVSDWLMPGTRGDEFLIQIHQRFPSIVTVLLTGHADETAIERARQYANLHAYIAKPWSEETLIDVIRSGLGKLDDESSDCLCG